MVPRIRTLWSVLLVAVLFGGTAAADVLHLKKGGRLEGVLVGETSTALTIDLGMGRITLPRSAVYRVERKESALSEYRTRLGAIKPGDVNAFVELARYAASNDLRSEARLMWARVVSLDPTNVEGHLYLGHVLVAGRYMAEDEAQRAQGMVRFDGRWMTPGEQDSILRERDRRASDDRLDEARRAARDAEDRARRAEREVERARADAAANSPGAWGYGSSVVIGSPYGYGGGYGGGYGAGCGGYPCTSVPQHPRHPRPAPVATPYPQVKPLRPSSIW